MICSCNHVCIAKFFVASSFVDCPRCKARIDQAKMVPKRFADDSDGRVHRFVSHRARCMLNYLATFLCERTSQNICIAPLMTLAVILTRSTTISSSTTITSHASS